MSRGNALYSPAKSRFGNSNSAPKNDLASRHRHQLMSIWLSALAQGRRDRALRGQFQELRERRIGTAPPARERRNEPGHRHHRVAIERAHIDFADQLAARAHVRQPRRTGEHHGFKCRIERWPRAPCRPAVPDSDELHGLCDIATGIALALLILRAPCRLALSRHPPFVEAHCPLPPRPPRPAESSDASAGRVNGGLMAARMALRPR